MRRNLLLLLLLLRVVLVRARGDHSIRVDVQSARSGGAGCSGRSSHRRGGGGGGVRVAMVGCWLKCECVLRLRLLLRVRHGHRSACLHVHVHVHLCGRAADGEGQRRHGGRAARSAVRCGAARRGVRGECAGDATDWTAQCTQRPECVSGVEWRRWKNSVTVHVAGAGESGV